MSKRVKNVSQTKIVYCALMAAITCIATMVIRVPSIGAVGYVNIGDTAVLLSAWQIGGVYGALAAGVGSALADLLAGYAYYVPGTFIIKFLMALVASVLIGRAGRHFAEESRGRWIAAHVISGVSAELIMIAGYFFYKALILGKGFAAAVPSVFTNIAQAITCLITAIAAAILLKKANFNME